MNKEEVIDAIIELARKRREGEPIGNEEIYRFVTKRQRYNRKAWEELKPILREIAGKVLKGYLFFTFNPMLANRYNFKIHPELEWMSDWCAGFQLWKRGEE